jgi:hypothetical protein
VKIRQFALVCGLGVAGAALTLSACGKKDSGGSGGDGDGDGDVFGDGDGDGDGDPDPVISSAPPAWVLPGDCKGVGNSCATGAAGCQNPDSACQLEGYVCIPGGSLRSQTEETPYCASYTCMSFEEASCYCLGEFGSARPDCASPEQLAGLCGSSSDDCETEADCCDGMACIPERYSSDLHCRETCETDDDCSTGCCNDSLDTGVKICSTASFCETACKVEGETDCTDGNPNTPSLCCRGTCIEAEDDRAGCRPLCDDSSECESNCCRPFSNADGGYCAPSTYCDESGEPLGGSSSSCNDGAGCADGETCVVSENVEFAGCQPECGESSECDSNCCRPFANGSGGFCAPSTSCDENGQPLGGGGTSSCNDGAGCAEGEDCVISETAEFAGCQPACTGDTDCASGCCRMYQSGDSGFCVDALYCSCVDVGGACIPKGITIKG